MSGEAKVYLVMGSTGEYSDNVTWAVAAYLDRVLADRHADAATIRAKPLVKVEDEYGCRRYSDDAWLTAQMGDLDPHARMDYTGTDYYVVDAPLLASVPEPAP